MDNSYVPTIEEQEMLVTERDGSTCIDTENEKIETCILPLRTLMDVDNSITSDEYTMEITSLTGHPHPIEVSQMLRPLKPRSPYRRYTAHQIEKSYDLVTEEGKTAKEGGSLTGINIRTAQHYIKKKNDDEESRLPTRLRKVWDWK